LAIVSSIATTTTLADAGGDMQLVVEGLRTLSVDVCRMSGFGATNHAVKVLKFGETRPRAAADVERSSPSCNACD
jgi:hypothetical protein